MKENLKYVILDYSCKIYEEYAKNIAAETKENLITILTDLIELTINDKNSSLLREEITALVAGYIPIDKKIGPDAYKIDDYGNKHFAEIKPKNIYLKDDGKFNGKLNGAGNFTDFRFEKLNKNKESKLIMLVSGFCNGKLIYILEFNFDEVDFIEKMEKNLRKKYPDGKDVKGDWLRSSTFSFKDYKNAKTLHKIYTIENLEQYEKQISKDLYEYLLKK